MKIICDVLKDTKDGILHIILMFMIFNLTLPAKEMPICAYLVAQWHLTSPPFDSMKDG